MLLDEGSFVEFDELARHRSTAFGMERNRPYGDGVVTGYGTVDGRQVAVFAQDFTVSGGSLGEVFGEKIVKVMDLALRTGCPMIGINDSGGARIQEGVVALGLYGEIFKPQHARVGRHPADLADHGPVRRRRGVLAGASPTSSSWSTRRRTCSSPGPTSSRRSPARRSAFEELGGAHAHNTKSGNAHYQAGDEEDAIDYVKALLSYLPSNNLDPAPSFPDAVASLDVTEEDRALDTLVPGHRRTSRTTCTRSSRPCSTTAISSRCSRCSPANIIVGFGRVEGQSVGVVANQPMQFAGTLDIDASEKAARFVRTCDAFNLPVLTFVDVPGFLPGTDQEWNGIIRRGAKLIYAYAEATVPLVTIITRKAYGGAYDVMGSKHLGADVNLAWPSAQIAVMGAQGAVNILYRRELAEADDPAERRAELVTEYEDTLANPYVAAERGYVDAVIEPSSTRVAVVKALRALRDEA